jgi:hypothetical protein
MPLNPEFLPAVTVLLGAILLPAGTGSVVVPVQANHCMGHRPAADPQKSQSMLIQASYVAAAPPTKRLAQSAVPGRPFITSLSPEAGPIGTLVTVRGAGFVSNGNAVQFEGEKTFLAGSPVGSKDGITLQFQVTPCPAHELQCPTFNPPTGAYAVSVTNALGVSNRVTFNLTR